MGASGLRLACADQVFWIGMAGVLCVHRWVCWKTVDGLHGCRISGRTSCSELRCYGAAKLWSNGPTGATELRV